MPRYDDVIAFRLNFMFDNDIVRKNMSTINKITSKLNKLLKPLNEEYDLNVFHYTLNLDFKLHISKYADLEYLKYLEDHIYEIVKSNVDFDDEQEDCYNSIITLYEMPDRLIQWKTIELIPEKPILLTNIHKLIKAEYFTIYRSQNVAGNILGLIPLSSNTNLRIILGREDWWYILEKHNDILECQEELIANGLNEYAKL